MEKTHALNFCNSCENFSYYLKFQLDKQNQNKILIAFDTKYLSIIDQLRKSLSKNFEVIGIHEIIGEKNKILELYPLCDRAIFFYDHFTRENLKPGFSDEMQPFSDYFSKDPLKVIFINDMYEQFNDVYSIAPQRIKFLNEQLMHVAQKSKILEITDNQETYITVNLELASPWSSIDGTTFGEIIPGEIASYSPEISGTLFFTGSFLSMIPFGIKHGVIVDPVKFEIQKSQVCSFECRNLELSKDLNYFFEYLDDHAHIHEIGIGTNEGITNLYGKNASFEEKHCGIHFGLGGKADDSFHLDMMMKHSSFRFDDQLVYDGKFLI